jgi:ketosteroid isomerase-like protein
MSDEAAVAPGLEALTRDYLDAFAARDLERCLAFYADDASLDFQLSVFRGRKGIEAWHQDRFAANLRILRLESITVREGTVVVDAVVASDRLAAWKIGSLSGRVTLRFEGGRIAEARLAPRMMSPVDMVRAG